MNPFEKMKYGSTNKGKSFTSIKKKLLKKARVKKIPLAYMTKNSNSQKDLKFFKRKVICGRKSKTLSQNHKFK